MSEEKKTGLELLREPFPDHQISKLPKPTKAQTDEVKADYKKGIRCKLCGAWHHPQVEHLDYVGHAALTDRLLDADPSWHWEPMAFDSNGLPKFDESGGLWIKLTVCGVTRFGYGHAEGSSFKDIGSREKEVIGDALRNAAMRFGAALELWHKGDLHKPSDALDDSQKPTQPRKAEAGQIAKIKTAFEKRGVSEAKIIEKLSLKSLQDLTLENVEELKEIYSQIEQGKPITQFFAIKNHAVGA